MAAEFIRHLLRGLPFENIPSTQMLFGDRNRGIPPLDRRVGRLIAEASTAEIYGNHHLAKRLSRQAAVAARAAYYRISEQETTASNRLSKARHAEVAVARFISGEAIEEARRFGESVLTNTTLPAVTLGRIRQELEQLGE
jgi:hypothetical protein